MSKAPNLPESTVKAHNSPPEELLIIQRNPTTVEVCGLDATFPSFLGTSEFFYDSHAVYDIPSILPPSNNLARPHRYENPLITATSRALISDIHALTRRCCTVDVPRPLSILRALLRVRPPKKFDYDPWFQAIRIWAEVDDVSETESFDGHKKSFVEYTLNVLFFPDLHSTYRMPKTLSLRRPLPSPAESQLSLPVLATPSLSIPGTLISVPSPLHFQLPVMTRLIFNEQGQITYHRDVWDFADVVRLIPGVRMILWMMARAGAWGLSWIGQIMCSSVTSDAQKDKSMNGHNALLAPTAESRV